MDFYTNQPLHLVAGENSCIVIVTHVLKKRNNLEYVAIIQMNQFCRSLGRAIG